MTKDIEGNGTEFLLDSDVVIDGVFDALAEKATKHVFWGVFSGIGMEVDGKNENEDGLFLFFESPKEIINVLTLYNHIAILPAVKDRKRYMISLGVSRGRYPRNIAVAEVAKRTLRQGPEGVANCFEDIVGNRNTSEVSIIASTKRNEIVFFEKAGDAGKQDYSGFGKEYRKQTGWHPNVISAIKKQLEKML